MQFFGYRSLQRCGMGNGAITLQRVTMDHLSLAAPLLKHLQWSLMRQVSRASDRRAIADISEDSRGPKGVGATTTGTHGQSPQNARPSPPPTGRTVTQHPPPPRTQTI